MIITSWQGLAESIVQFCKPYDDFDIEPEGTCEITRDGPRSTLKLEISWPPKPKAKGKRK
jgi:hypothetical protein